MVEEGISWVTLAYRKQFAPPDTDPASTAPWSNAAPAQAGRLQHATRHAPAEGRRENCSRDPWMSVLGAAVKFMGRAQPVGGTTPAAHAPAVAGVVVALAQQAHLAQVVGDTPMAQQHPPRHSG